MWPLVRYVRLSGTTPTSSSTARALLLSWFMAKSSSRQERLDCKRSDLYSTLSLHAAETTSLCGTTLCQRFILQNWGRKLLLCERYRFRCLSVLPLILCQAVTKRGKTGRTIANRVPHTGLPLLLTARTPPLLETASQSTQLPRCGTPPDSISKIQGSRCCMRRDNQQRHPGYATQEFRLQDHTRRLSPLLHIGVIASPPSISPSTSSRPAIVATLFYGEPTFGQVILPIACRAVLSWFDAAANIAD